MRHISPLDPLNIIVEGTRFPHRRFFIVMHFWMLNRIYYYSSMSRHGPETQSYASNAGGGQYSNVGWVNFALCFSQRLMNFYSALLRPANPTSPLAIAHLVAPQCMFERLD